MDRERRFRYGPWRGGPDPLAPPFDLREALDRLGNEVLSGSSVSEALRELLRRGVDRGDQRRRGLDDLAERVRRRRAELRRRGDLAGPLTRARQLLDQALSAERDTLAADPSPDARMAELELATVPDDVARAIEALQDYPWRSDEARQAYEEITRMLREEVMSAQFQGMAEALRDPAATAEVQRMLTALNALLAAHARGEDTTDAFARFMDEFGRYFPENPRNTDELIDLLAQRAAAAERLMRSLSDDQRRELADLMRQSMEGTGLDQQMAELRDNLRALRPSLSWGRPARIGGSEPMGYDQGVGAISELAELEALAEQLGQGYPGASLDDIDVEAVERHVGPEAARDAEALRELERELERAGYLTSDRASAGTRRLTPKALRRLGESALRRIFAHLQASGRGDHTDHRSGAADEPTGASRQWAFGDEQPIDTIRTVGNAVLRSRGSRAPDEDARTGGDVGRGVELTVDDFEVAETERRTVAAVALCVDLSYSMVSEGRWGPMKQTALALAHLVSTRFRQDALQIIGFDRYARRLSPVDLAGIEPEMIQGTNLQHALLLAGRHIRRHPDAEPVVLVVTDGEPTAHLEPDGTPFFHWPTIPETVSLTVAAVDALTRYGASLNVFRLGDDPGLARFVDAVARRSGGRVFAPSPERLGEYVVTDYLRARRGARGRRAGRAVA